MHSARAADATGKVAAAHSWEQSRSSVSWVEQLAPTPPATAALAINYLLYSSQVTARPWAHTWPRAARPTRRRCVIARRSPTLLMLTRLFLHTLLCASRRALLHCIAMWIRFTTTQGGRDSVLAFVCDFSRIMVAKFCWVFFVVRYILYSIHGWFQIYLIRYSDKSIF